MKRAFPPGPPLVLRTAVFLGLFLLVGGCASPYDSGGDSDTPGKADITGPQTGGHTASQPLQCPTSTQKDIAPILDPATLPRGYYLFDGGARYPGLFGSRIERFLPFLVPNTEEDYPLGMAISDDGRWVVYFEDSSNQIFLIRPDGRDKTPLPVSLHGLQFDKGQRTVPGFLRKSPRGTEIYYLAGPRELRAISVDLSGEQPGFGIDRCLVRFEDIWSFHPDPMFTPCVVADQVFGLLINSESTTNVDYTGFVTIPNGGLGVASSDNIYTYSVPIEKSAAGCAHTMSHDGAYAVANANRFGGTCVPKRHNGFYMIPFLRDTAAPLDPYTEMIETRAISINWCPHEYRYGGCGLVDWTNWHFTNDNRYIICRLAGSKTVNGVWMNRWQGNAWYPLTPRTTHIVNGLPAAYIGAVDDILGDVESRSPVRYDSICFVPLEPSDPGYELVYPDSGQVFYIGDTVMIHVRSRRTGNAALSLSLDAGRSYFPIPGIEGSFDPTIDSVHPLVLRDSVYAYDGYRSMLSDQCRISIWHYGSEQIDGDESRGSFTIAKRPTLSIRR